MASNANRSTIGWDAGTCYAWGTNEIGVTETSTVNCSVVRSEVYFNQNAGLSADWPAATALHELGHYQNAAHQWGVVSIMGSSDAPLPGLVSDQRRAQSDHFPPCAACDSPRRVGYAARR